LAKAKKNTEKEDLIAEALDKAGIAYEREFKGIEGRQFRFDFAIPSLKIAIEYEGGVFRKKSRHTSAFGYSSDCKKYNLAALRGWAVLRYSTVETKELFWLDSVITEVKELISLRKI